MGNKLKLLAVIVLTLLNTQGCIEPNQTNAVELKTEPITGISYSTTVLGTVPPYVEIVFDDTSFFFYDRDSARICKMNKVSGQMNVLSITNREFWNLCLNGNYLYGYQGGFNSHSVYRIDKNFAASPELFATFDKNIQHMEAAGNYLYIRFDQLSDSGRRIATLYKYDVLKKDTVLISDQINWYDADREDVYWMSADTLWKMSHTSSTPVKLACGELWDAAMSESHIYFLDGDDNLIRVSKSDGIMETILSAPVGFSDDNGYVVQNEKLYATDYYDATLSVCNLKSSQKSFITLEKKGRFDEDDMRCWLWADKDALYWVAGPDENTRISDEQWGTLFKTVIR